MIPCWWRRTRVPLKLFVGITDRDWYELPRQLLELDEVNFWARGGIAFKALRPGELVLLQLHAPDHYIVGGRVFAYVELAAVLAHLKSASLAANSESFERL